MPKDLVIPAIIMSLAFVFYTAGVWSERIQRNLHHWHVALFWLGLVCDGISTSLMRRLAAGGQEPGIVHTVTGGAAFGLMALHALWASWVIVRGSEEARRGFHRYSIIVWTVWLIPYLGGMMAGIARGTGG